MLVKWVSLIMLIAGAALCTEGDKKPTRSLREADFWNLVNGDVSAAMSLNLATVHDEALAMAAGRATQIGATLALERILEEKDSRPPVACSRHRLLNLAAEKGQLGSMKVLLKHSTKADLDGERFCSNNYCCSNTPLQWAASKGDAAIAQLLLLAGANPILDCYGDTPYDYARKNGRSEIMAIEALQPKTNRPWIVGIVSTVAIAGGSLALFCRTRVRPAAPMDVVRMYPMASA